MRLSRTAAPCLFIFIAASSAGLDVSIAASTTGGVGIVRDGRFAAGLQPLAGAGAVATVSGARGFGAGLALEGQAAWPSAVRDLVSYRGSTGIGLKLFATWEAPGTGRPLAPGARAGLLASYQRYRETEVWFLAAGLFLEPLLAFSFPRVPWLALRVGIPLLLVRRADLTVAASGGLSVEAGAAIRIREVSRDDE